MSKLTVIDGPELTLWYHRDKRIIHHQLHKYPGTKVLESALEKGLATLREHGAHKWLSDDRNSGALPKSHHEWAQNVWGPKAAGAGWRYWALVPPTEMLGSANMSRLKEIYGALGVTANVFSDPFQAMAWLMQCPE